MVAPFGADPDETDFFNLSATVRNSCVRSRNDDCDDLNCIFEEIETLDLIRIGIWGRLIEDITKL